MNRLMENSVFSGFTTAWRLAVWPTRRSPFLVNATTDGHKGPPSAVGMTIGSPPSTTATTLFVVPRSIPTTLLIAYTPLDSLRLAIIDHGWASTTTVWRSYPSPVGKISVDDVY